MALTKVTNRMIEGASFNVLDFGAVGDGSTDDAAAINAAFAACETAGYGTVFFPARTYKIKSLIGSSGSTNLSDIAVLGEPGTEIDADPDVGSNYVFYLQWDNLRSIRMENFLINGNDKCARGVHIRSGAGFDMEFVLVQKVDMFSIKIVNDASITENAVGIFIDSDEGYRARVTQCRVNGVTRDKTATCAGITITDFRNMVVEDCHIKNIRHDGTTKLDADGIKIFSERTTGSFFKTNARVANNTLIDCEGRFIKLQTGGVAIVQGNTMKIDGALDLIVNFVGIDSQAGEATAIDNKMYFGTSFTENGSTACFQLQSPDSTAPDYNYQSFVNRFENNHVDVRKSIPYVFIVTPPDDNESVMQYQIIRNNTVNTDDDTQSTNQSNNRPDYFIYANGASFPSVANFDATMHWIVEGNVVYTFEFLVVSSGSSDYADKWFLEIHNNTKYPHGYSRSLLGAGSHYTSSVSISGNKVGSDNGSVEWNLNWQKLLPGCSFYFGNGTSTNGPGADTFREWAYDGRVYKLWSNDRIALSYDASTWNTLT